MIIHKSEISLHYCILIKINKNQLLSDVPTLSLDSLHREMNSLTDRRADRQTNRRTNKQMDKQTNRQTDLIFRQSTQGVLTALEEAGLEFLSGLGRVFE